MSAGAVLVGIAVLAVVVAYVARPFRSLSRGDDMDETIEAWIAQVELETGEERITQGNRVESKQEKNSVINHCSQCGRRVSVDDRFCSGCGTGLRGEVQ